MRNIVRWIRVKNRNRLEGRRAKSCRRSPCLSVDFSRPVCPESIIFDCPVDPEVSIIVPSFGDVTTTLRCLNSLFVCEVKCTFELIVVVDSSDDGSIEALRAVKGVKLLFGHKGQGFGLSCNKAVDFACGDFVYLLRSDAIVQPGAVDALVEMARLTSNAGIVGSKIIDANGLLREAGGVLLAGGEVVDYGYLQDASEPRYNYVREADYISSISILIRRDLWMLAGGFDPSYPSVHYADIDFSIRLQKMGYITLYVPQSVVAHIVPASGDAVGESNAKSIQAKCRREFCAAHQDFVRKTRGFSGRTSYYHADSLRRRSGLVLMIDHHLPEPDVDAGSRNIIDFIKILQSLNYVVKFWPQNLTAKPQYLSLLEAMGVETLRGPYQCSFQKWVASVGSEISHVFLSRPSVAPFYFDAVRRYTKAKVIYYGHDLHYARMRMEASVKGDLNIAEAAEKMRRTELDIWERSDVVLYPSQEEVDAVIAESPRVRAMFVPPFKFDCFAVKSKPHCGHKILFVAGFKHSPNVDAAEWLASEIMPRVWQRCPAAELYLVGSSPTEAVQSLANIGRVSVTGAVSFQELAEHYASARVAVVPLRFGAGVKLKVLEAMQSGVPLVTTSVGLQGLPGASSILEPSDTADHIAREIVRFLQSDQDWIARSNSQTCYVESQFSTQAMRERFFDLMGAGEGKSAFSQRL